MLESNDVTWTQFVANTYIAFNINQNDVLRYNVIIVSHSLSLDNVFPQTVTFPGILFPMRHSSQSSVIVRNS